MNATTTPAVATYTVTFTEKTDYTMKVEANSPLEAARKAKADYDLAGPEDFEAGFSEGVDWSVTDPNGGYHDYEDDELDEDGSGEPVIGAGEAQ